MTIRKAEEYPLESYGHGWSATKYRPERCAEQLSIPGRVTEFKQCGNKPGHGPRELFCKKCARRFATPEGEVYAVRVGRFSNNRIRVCGLIHETDKYITITGLFGSDSKMRVRKDGDRRFFHDRAEALAFIIKRQQGRVEGLTSQLSEAEAELERLRRVENGEEEL